MQQSSDPESFELLSEIAASFRTSLANKNTVLVYAHNGIGKTRLSMAFKDVGKNGGQRDTLYYNAFTEDLFSWDNDLDGDLARRLKLNSTSHFFGGLRGMDIENLVRAQLGRYADFDFRIDTTYWTVSFRRRINGRDIEDIKVSRSEESIFIWCFFLAVFQMVLDEVTVYNWVKYVYIDDPVSSLDDNNVIAIASNLAQLLKRQGQAANTPPRVRAIVSSHHTLFFNVMCMEMSSAKTYTLDHSDTKYTLKSTGATPFFQHIAALVEMKRVADSGSLFTYHFNMLRGVLEKTASFHGLKGFAECIKTDPDDTDGIVRTRIVNLLNHSGYSLFDPVEMVNENKVLFRKVLTDTLARFPFDPKLFETAPAAATTP